MELTKFNYEIIELLMEVFIWFSTSPRAQDNYLKVIQTSALLIVNDRRWVAMIP